MGQENVALFKPLDAFKYKQDVENPDTGEKEEKELLYVVLVNRPPASIGLGIKHANIRVFFHGVDQGEKVAAPIGPPLIPLAGTEEVNPGRDGNGVLVGEKEEDTTEPSEDAEEVTGDPVDEFEVSGPTEVPNFSGPEQGPQSAITITVFDVLRDSSGNFVYAPDDTEQESPLLQDGEEGRPKKIVQLVETFQEERDGVPSSVTVLKNPDGSVISVKQPDGSFVDEVVAPIEPPMKEVRLVTGRVKVDGKNSKFEIEIPNDGKTVEDVLLMDAVTKPPESAQEEGDREVGVFVDGNVVGQQKPELV
jgi:hypothetical protein